jgi:alpha-tubulin suppressor-like RCC1 family protein
VAAHLEVDAGGSHSCFLRVTSEIFCAGENTFGQLGDGSGVDQRDEVPLSGQLSWIAVSAGLNATCMVNGTDGAGYCVGMNSSGQLGDGTNSSAFVRVPVSGGHRFTRISVGGSTTCGVDAGTGSVWCWGFNQAGQLGIGARGDRNVPVQVVQ